MLGLRLATTDDMDELRKLDDLCFPLDDEHRERAAPGELEAGVGSGSITVALIDTMLVGFLHVEHPSPEHTFISALAVHPQHQGNRIGTQLLDHFLSGLDSRPRDDQSVTTVTSLTNIAMQRLLFSKGFIARTLFDDYFGPGRHRLYCQLSTTTSYVHPDDRYLLPVTANGPANSMLRSGRYSITDVLKMDSGWVYEVSRFDEDDVSALQSAESNAGIAFSTAVLAALTFLLAFALASGNYPDSVRIILIAATLGTMLSLIIYANASGELARIRSNTFSEHMKWGNALSEYAGVQPFAIVLPAVLTQIGTSSAAAIAAGCALTVGLLAYERSPFALTSRYPRNRIFTSLSFLTPFLAVAGSLSASASIAGWIWAILVVAILGLRILIVLPADIEESSSVLPSSHIRARR